MGMRAAQEFWDHLWIWETHETYANESQSDPLLVDGLSFQIEAAGNDPDPALFQRYDHCVGRVIMRFDELFPRRDEDIDFDEMKRWLEFGLDLRFRGHGGARTPIIDANSLRNFTFFARHAVMYGERHGQQRIVELWRRLGQLSEEIDSSNAGDGRESRFDIASISEM